MFLKILQTMTGTNLNEAIADKIAALGKYLNENFAISTMTLEKEKEILKKWDISKKTFDRLFSSFSGERVAKEKKTRVQYGSDNGRSKPVKNLDTDEVYDSVVEAGKAFHINPKTVIYNMKHNPNRYPLIYVER
jgi:hypothetical protein